MFYLWCYGLRHELESFRLKIYNNYYIYYYEIKNVETLFLFTLVIVGAGIPVAVTLYLISRLEER